MLDELLLMSPTEFEHAVAAYLRERGYADVRRVGGSGDLGVDVFARDPAGALVAVQAKRYASDQLIGSPAIQAFFGMVVHHGVERGIFVTTSAYTEPARELAAAALAAREEAERELRLLLARATAPALSAGDAPVAAQDGPHTPAPADPAPPPPRPDTRPWWRRWLGR